MYIRSFYIHACKIKLVLDRNHAPEYRQSKACISVSLTYITLLNMGNDRHVYVYLFMDAGNISIHTNIRIFNGRECVIQHGKSKDDIHTHTHYIHTCMHAYVLCTFKQFSARLNSLIVYTNHLQKARSL